MRARGAWFGNRSISAEVDLEPGKYEVIPKIVASKDDSAPEVIDVVTKLANTNPQKLRQIGMNYDIANAKGIVELSEEEKKKKEQKKAEIAEKKLKEKEEAEREKIEFEAWKKEKRERESKEDTKSSEAKTEPTSAPTVEERKDDTTAPKITGVGESTQTGKKGDEPTNELSQKETRLADNDENKKDTKPPGDDDKKDVKSKDGDNSSEGTAEATPDSENDVPVPPPPPPAYGAGPYSVYGDAPPPPPPPPASDNTQKPWNAVCILGLRVYSQDPEVSIKLTKPKDPEEGAVLDAGGDAQAGATM